MSRWSIVVVLVLIPGPASAAWLTENFESGWSGAGTLVADPENPGNTALKLVGGESISFVLEGAWLVSMDIYDPGQTTQDEGMPSDGNDYGPRWGVAGLGTSTAVSIINKTFLNCRNGYGYGEELSRTGKWYSPKYFGGPRRVDALQVIGTGTKTAPEIAGDGAWTTWEFTINSTSGDVTIRDLKGNWQVSSAIGLALEAWVSGGSSDAAEGELGVAGVLVDNVHAVPEPATLSLLALGGLALLRRRRV